MRKVENECVGCVDVGFHCIGFGCPNRRVVRFYCDECGEEETLYHYEDSELCKECLIKKFEVVEGSEEY